MQPSRHQRPPIGGQSGLGQLAALVAILIAIVAGLSGIQGQAAENDTIISIGESNTPEQRQELLGYFGADSNAQVEIVTVEDTREAMLEVIPDFSISSAYSSTALTCRELGEGLDVSTINISEITPAIYAMSLVTAGIGDANLIVAAPADKAAGGMTALTGIFQAWDKMSCDSAQTSAKRQELALRELALTVEIANALGVPLTGATGYFVIEVQRNVVVSEAASREEITAEIANQERVFGLTIPEAQRAKLIDFMVDLVAQDIDWSTFSKGWTIEQPSSTSITMDGDGIAIRNAQASATAKAANEQTATAQASKDKTATARAEARLTQTAEAQDAADSLTATALAQPTATATATPEPNTVLGELAGPITNGQLPLKAVGGSDQSYPVAQTVTVTRDAEAAQTADLKKGDAVTLKVDAVTGEVVSIAAIAPEAGGTPLAKLLYILPLLLIIPLGMVVKSRGGIGMGDPFIVKRVDRG
jgi:uncharacterized protein YpuA (DUF1002 family)